MITAKVVQYASSRGTNRPGSHNPRVECSSGSIAQVGPPGVLTAWVENFYIPRVSVDANRSLGSDRETPSTTLRCRCWIFADSLAEVAAMDTELTPLAKEVLAKTVYFECQGEPFPMGYIAGTQIPCPSAGPNPSTDSNSLIRILHLTRILFLSCLKVLQVIHVLRNRVRANIRRWGGNTVEGVCLLSGQFDCWKSVQLTPDEMEEKWTDEALRNEDIRERTKCTIEDKILYEKVCELIPKAWTQEDITLHRCTHFNNPSKHNRGWFLMPRVGLHIPGTHHAFYREPSPDIESH
ncbi:unnamed protein product [Cyprideis torosa]|uniref:Uncharacterized protein n=1 Tax=Cyprideis torosa TaxID=163714 RepID=A0A7R8WGS2_9CRUS|nr:unnamed protein product [Cyprideis torosa]CAG0892417.1 unnamed protein product [Cyprideis torosa]